MSRVSKRSFEFSSKKRELLEALLQEEGVDLSSAQKISRRREADSLPLSFAQQRLWFLNQLEPDSPFYNVPAALRLSGPLNVAALEQSINEIIRRHESLRTTFAAVDGTPVQVIAPTLTLTLPIIDLKHLPESRREAETLRLVTEKARLPFDLAHGPLIRATLLRLDEEENVLLSTIHHIAADGWSTGVFSRELSVLYETFSQSKSSPLAELPIQYADYAVWQREWLQGEVLEKQLSYWKEKLAGAPAVLELPTDRPHPFVQSYQGAKQRLTLSKNVTEGIKRLSQREGTTLFMTLLAAFQTLLMRYTSQDDIVVGTPIAGRSQAETENLIGFFVNTLALRTDLSGDPSFKELLARVKEVTLGAYTHQDVPFEKLVEELQPERSLSRTPLFQVVFALHNMPGQASELSGLKLSGLPLDIGKSQFDLSLFAFEGVEGLSCVLEYSTDLFDAATATRMLGHFARLLEGIAAEPEQCLSKLPLLSEVERHQLLVEWNDTATVYPKAQTIHELFEARVEQRPDAVAVVFEDQQLTYGELNRRANQVAHYLRRSGVEPEVRVGIMMERSVDLVVGLLGILKAGGAYVPLDAAYPKERLAFVLEDADLPVLLTQARLHTELPGHRAKVVCLDTEWADIARESVENPVDTMVTADNLAYVIYTSGSTGQPKGVLVTHHNVVRLFKATEAWFNFKETDVWTLFHSYAFDFSVWELWGALAYGGRLVVVPYLVSRSPEAFYDLLRREQVTVLNQTPSAFHQLMQAEERAGAVEKLGLRFIIFGGEALELQGLRSWFARHGDEQPQLVNMYGITETTVHVTYRPLTMADVERSAGSVIGRHIPDMQVYVLDGQLQPVPVGVPGELYIGGAGVARGYLNRIELTDERFIADQFSGQAEGRLYKSGDLGRYLPDGEMEYLGRIDQQVKIRGFRIELGEIEAVISQHATVREVVVTVREDVPGDKRLVAYLVAAQEQSAPSTGELRSYLKEKLPEYMVPGVFVMLDALPLTPNGKVNRRALPAPDEARPELEQQYVTPRNAVEEVMAGIWAEVLKVEEVGIHDNFFDLGGHSLLATQVVSRVRTALQVELPLRALFEEPTVVGLAKRVDEARQTKTSAHITPLRAIDRNGVIPLSFAQQRLWFLDQLEPGSAFYNMPAARRLSGHLNVEALEQALTAIVARHESLRTTFTTVDESPVQVIAPAQRVALPVIDLSNLPASDGEAEAQRLATEEMLRPFNLAQGPLVRASLLRLQAEEHVLLLSMHHIISDGWSLAILFRELTTLYAAFGSGQPSPLQKLPIQYADYAVWQRDWLQGEVLEEQLAYWKAQLAGAQEVLELPTDRARPAMQTFRGARQFMTLPKSVSEALRSLSRQEGVTFFITLLAAFQTLLMRYSGQHDIVVGSPIAGRTRTETEELIGFFANTLALRTDLSGDPSFRELLARVREVTLGAYEHQDIPFEKLVEELQPERTLSHAPLFQVMFSLQDAQSKVLNLHGLSLSSVSIDTGTSKFDLTLQMSEGAEGLNGRLEYNTDLFDEATITRMLTHFEVLLRGIATDPNRCLSQLPLLIAAEQRQLLVEWNATHAEYPRDLCAHHLFEAQAALTPEAVAVVFQDQRFTYAQLNERANQLAHYLRARGVGPEARVGILVERSLEMVVGVLGILKAGGSYVPLDPAYPAERLAFMLADAAASVLLTQHHLVPVLPPSDATVVCLDADWAAIAEQRTENLASAVEPDNLAYVIYTSGSTGRPKGVAMPHRALVNLVEWQMRHSALGAGARTLQFASLSFDVSFQEMFSTWRAGGELVLIPEELRRDPAGLLRLLEEEAVERLFVPFVALQQLSEVSDSEGIVPSGLREVVTAGEQLQITRQVASLFGKLRGCTLDNHYGPSESHVVTAYRLSGEVGEWAVLPPIGRPIANTEIYILDGQWQPVPVGVAGELYLGGDGLARGYLNRAELTAERFIAHPFCAEASGRLYRTGDLARYMADGNVEFLGRKDEQVKLRGYRIELGEVEAVLSEHRAVREAAAVVREDVVGDKRLVAYVVAHGDESVAGGELRRELSSDWSGEQRRSELSSELRRHMKEKVPEYMVPASFVVLDELPLTPSGKVDRRALPAPDEGRREIEQQYVGPRSAVEEVVAGIWAEVLKVERVGIHDNFFELGGHSLLATQVISRVRKSLQVEMPLRTLFEEPTVAGLTKEAVRIWGDPDVVEDIARIFKELEHLSEDEVKLMLSEQMQQVEHR